MILATRERHDLDPLNSCGAWCGHGVRVVEIFGSEGYAGGEGDDFFVVWEGSGDGAGAFGVHG